MATFGMLDKESESMAATQRIVLQRFHGGFSAPHAVDLDLQLTPTSTGEVRTSLDAVLQAKVENMVEQRLASLRDRHVEHAAVVVLENRTRRVLALVGSRDYHAPDGGQINGAWTPRSPGSALKPFTYSLAFESGATPATLLADLPVEFATPTGVYRPENYDKRLYGPITCRQALGNSLNIAAVRLLDSTGGPKALVERLQKLGITTLTEPAEHYGLGLTIGNAPVRLIELTNAYATLASLGNHLPWSLRADAPPANPTRVIDESAAWLLADILSDNQARLMSFGNQSVIRLPFRVAVKTGTSTSYRDNWTLGFTPEFTVGVWAGNFEGQPMEQVSGVTGAGPIFRDVFMHLRQVHGTTWFDDPPWLVRARIDPRTGKRVVPRGPTPRLSRAEVFHKDRLPAPAQTSDYEARTGKAILPPEYSAWVVSGDNWLHGLVTTDARHRHVETQITSPLHGSVVVMDPDLPGGGRLLLRTEPAGDVKWVCDTLRLEIQPEGTFARLQPGNHTIAAIRDGQSVRSTFTVKPPPTAEKKPASPPVSSPP
jgi:penicillin-binding protein 1C